MIKTSSEVNRVAELSAFFSINPSSDRRSRSRSICVPRDPVVVISSSTLHASGFANINPDSARTLVALVHTTTRMRTGKVVSCENNSTRTPLNSPIPSAEQDVARRPPQKCLSQLSSVHDPSSRMRTTRCTLVRSLSFSGSSARRFSAFSAISMAFAT